GALLRGQVSLLRCGRNCDVASPTMHGLDARQAAPSSWLTDAGRMRRAGLAWSFVGLQGMCLVMPAGEGRPRATAARSTYGRRVSRAEGWQILLPGRSET